MKLVAYERELIGLVQAVRHWRPYLWGRRFVVRTDHYALKFLFAVEFWPGCLNVVADALSWHDEATDHLHTLSGPSFDLFDNLRHELDEDTALRALWDSIATDRGAPWRVVDGLILHGTRIFMLVQSALLPTVLELAHSVGHEGVLKTLHRLRG